MLRKIIWQDHHPRPCSADVWIFEWPEKMWYIIHCNPMRAGTIRRAYSSSAWSRVATFLACESTHISLVLTGFSTLCWYPQILLLWVAKGSGKASRNPTAWSLFANHTISSRQLAVDVRAGRIRPGEVTTTSKPHGQSFRDNKSEPLPSTDLSEELFGGELAQHNPRILLAH